MSRSCFRQPAASAHNAQCLQSVPGSRAGDPEVRPDELPMSGSTEAFVRFCVEGFDRASLLYARCVRTVGQAVRVRPIAAVRGCGLRFRRRLSKDGIPFFPRPRCFA